MNRKKPVAGWRLQADAVRVGTAFLVGFLGAHTAHAQSIMLPPVEVSANPIIENVAVDAYGGTSARITDAQIRDQNAIDLPSALRNTPGTEISRFNPVGSYAGDQGGRVFIRGMGAGAPGSEIQTYIDGVPVYSPVWGHPLLDTLPLNGMRSISVFKGPQPQISGNNFGSINLETRQATEEGDHGDGQISGGSFGTIIQKAEIYGRHGNVDYMLSQGYASSDGSRRNGAGTLANVLGRFGVQLNDHWRTDLSFMYVNSSASDPQSNQQPPVPITPHYDTQLGMAALSLSHEYEAVTGGLKLFMTAGNNQWKNTTYGLAPLVSNVYNAEYRFQTMGLRWQENVSLWKGGVVEVGIDYDQITGHNTTLAPFPTPVNVDSPIFAITSPHVGFHQKIQLDDTWALVPAVGLRLYEHNIFATELSPNAGLSLVSDRLTLFSAISRGVHYPGLEVFEFSQLYPFFGNTWRALSAERHDHVEIGLKSAVTDTTQVNASLFADWVSKRYAFNFATGQDINFGAYRTQGMELSVRQKIGSDWSVFAGWTILSPNVGMIPFMPHDAVVIGVNGTVGPVRVAVDAQYQSGMWAFTAFRGTGIPVAQQWVRPFAVANANLSYPVPALGQKGEIFLAVENLFNRTYYYTPGYPQPGTGVQIGVRASF